jgi:RNA polymerase sigma-70 factor (ECF subfamily)
MVGSSTITAATPHAVCDHASISREIPYLRRFARALANDATTADDLVHDCVVKALENMEKFEPGTNLRAWLFTILRNCFISDIRRNKRHLGAADSPRWARGGVAAPNQESALLLRRLQAELGRLPDDQRVVLILVVLEGMSYEQTAKMLEVPIGTVRSRLSRARHALRIAMDGTATTVEDRAARSLPVPHHHGMAHAA